MFADYNVICSESKEQVEEKLESWRYALGKRGMKVNRIKTSCVTVRRICTIPINGLQVYTSGNSSDRTFNHGCQHY